jgi:hypothetical protein
VSSSLTTVPWIDSDTIKADGKLRQVKFTVKDRAKFNLEEVKQAIGSRYASGLVVLTGPTEK